MEAVEDLLSQNPAGLVLYRDEFSGFIDSMNKYRSGDDEQKWMSIFNNIPFSIDRKGRDSVYVSNPYVVTCGGIQPEVLVKFREGFKGVNGFIDRFLFAYPNRMTAKPWSLIEMDAWLIAKYHKLVRLICETPEVKRDDGAIVPIMLKYSPAAKSKLLDWQKENTNMINTYTEPHMISMYKKLETYIHRFSLILSVMHYAMKQEKFIMERKIENLPVLPEHVAGAIKLIEYFRQCAMKVHAKLPQSTPIDKLTRPARMWYNSLPDEFITKVALLKAADRDISKRQAHYYLADESLFLKAGRGKYSKKYYSVEKVAE